MLSDNLFKGSSLESLVGGNLLTLGLWYLNRPFLLENFPNAASEAATSGMAGFGGKLVILTLSSIISAIFLSHLVQVVIPLMIEGDSYINKRHDNAKRLAAFMLKLFTFGSEPDPRIVIIRRYIASNRRAWFLEMASRWGRSSYCALQDDSEIIRVHQHITSRLRVVSEQTRSSLKEAYAEVEFSGSIFIAIMLLFPAGILSIYLNSTVSKVHTQHGLATGIIIFVIYVGGVASGFFFRRVLRNYFSKVIMLGLHYFDVLNPAPEPAGTMREPDANGAATTGGVQAQHSTPAP